MSRKNIDDLTPTSREFYERAYLKLSYSLMLASLSLMFLGFASSSGGLCQEATYHSKVNHLDDNVNMAEEDAAGGYGFACFMHICGSILAFAAALYISPYVSSKNEAKMIQSPIDMELSEQSPTQITKPILPYADNPMQKQYNNDPI